MHENGTTFHKLWITTTGNLRVEIRYQQLKVNFNYCFSHGIFQNQVYKFFVLFFGLLRAAVLSQDLFVFFSEFLLIRMFVKNSTFALQILEKQLHVCVTHTAQISTDFIVSVEIYLGKSHWRKKST